MINSVEWSCWIFIVFNIIILISELEAKPFSINEALAKEAALKRNRSLTSIVSEDSEQFESKPKTASRRKIYKPKHSKFDEDSAELETKPKNLPKRKYYKPTSTNLDLSSETFPLLRSLGLKPLKRRKQKKASAFLLPQRKRYAPTKYTELLQLRLPFKSKKLLSRRPSRQAQKIQDYRQNLRDELGNRYIPLARTLSMLFSDIIPNKSHESTERSDRYYTEEREDTVCTCTRKPKQRKPRKKTVALPQVHISTHSTQDQTEAATTTTNHTTHRNISSVRQNTNIPTILPRNTSSYDGDHNGLSQGSSTTFHGSTERNITRDHRDHELDTRDEGNETRATDDKETTDSLTRNGTSGRGHDREPAQFRRYTIDRRLLEGKQENETVNTSNEHARPEIDTQLTVGRDETEHSKTVRERSRKSISENQINIGRESVRPKEIDGKSNSGVPKRFTSHQRFFERNGATTEEDKEIRRTNERLVSIRDIRNPFDALESKASSDSYVVIIDGYSVTAGKSFINNLKPN